MKLHSCSRNAPPPYVHANRDLPLMLQVQCNGSVKALRHLISPGPEFWLEVDEPGSDSGSMFSSGGGREVHEPCEENGWENRQRGFEVMIAHLPWSHNRAGPHNSSKRAIMPEDIKIAAPGQVFSRFSVSVAVACQLQLYLVVYVPTPTLLAVEAFRPIHSRVLCQREFIASHQNLISSARELLDQVL
jgi:hypothetical protein